jgi:uncharacterized SAM-binding protein YcdF (DUF218 family)
MTLALVVLGCVVRRDDSHPTGLAPGAARRRVIAAAASWSSACHELAPSVVVATGGRMWEAGVEADAMARALARLGVPSPLITRERASLTTGDNAQFVAAICARRGIGQVTLVTCRWHLPRARMLFESAGLEVVQEVPAADGGSGWRERAWTWARERVLTTYSRGR